MYKEIVHIPTYMYILIHKYVCMYVKMCTNNERAWKECKSDNNQLQLFLFKLGYELTSISRYFQQTELNEEDCTVVVKYPFHSIFYSWQYGTSEGIS